MEKRHASPSDQAAAGLGNIGRKRIERVKVLGTFATGKHRFYAFDDCRVMSMAVWRRTAGDDGTTTVDLHAKKGSAAEASILSAAVSIPATDDDDVRKFAVLAGVDDQGGVALSAGDYFEVQVDAVEGANRADLYVDVELLIG